VKISRCGIAESGNNGGMIIHFEKPERLSQYFAAVTMKMPYEIEHFQVWATFPGVSDSFDLPPDNAVEADLKAAIPGSLVLSTHYFVREAA